MPGTANFLGSLLGLVSIGLELGDRRGSNVPDDTAVVDELRALDATVTNDGELALREASELQPPFFCIGSGPDLGIASFGVAKFIEAAATVGVAQDLEEWAHEQFFTTKPGTSVFLHASSAAVLDRAQRVAGSAVKVGGRLVTFSPEPLGVAEERHWALRATNERLAPLVGWDPMAISSQRGCAPTPVNPRWNAGAEGGIRTHDRRFTKPMLYP